MVIKYIWLQIYEIKSNKAMIFKIKNVEYSYRKG